MNKPEPPKILIAYFSLTNNTRTIAEQIQRRVGGDLFHVRAKDTYPTQHRQTVDRARRERNGNQRPALAETLSAEAMKRYDLVFVGFPSWFNTLPMPMFTFLEQFEWAGKTIVPFCTHEGSGLGSSIADLQRIVPHATLSRGLAIRGKQVARAQEDVDRWLRDLQMIR